MDDLSIHLNFIACMHRRVVIETRGGMHFSEGETWDDIQERLFCLDCMEYVTEAEVSAVRTNITLEINQPQMEIPHDHA